MKLGLDVGEKAEPGASASSPARLQVHSTYVNLCAQRCTPSVRMNILMEGGRQSKMEDHCSMVVASGLTSTFSQPQPRCGVLALDLCHRTASPCVNMDPLLV